MTDAADGSGFGRARKARQPLAVRLGLSARFHAFCARVPGLKHIVRAEGRALFFGPDGEPLPVGTVVKNPALAAFLQQLAEQGAVIAGFTARRDEIRRQLAAAAAAEGLVPIDDEALLDEVQVEDKGCTEKVYRGLLSSMGEPGPLSHLERPNFEFAQYIARMMPEATAALVRAAVFMRSRTPAMVGV